MISDFDVIEAHRRLLSRWTWLVAAGLMGGLLGFVASTLRPPVVQASAVIGIGIDRGRADVPDEVTVRQAYDRVRGLLLADDILDRAIDLAGQRAGGAPSAESVATFRTRIRLAEKADGWELFVMGTDSVEAERLAQAWADASLEGLDDASVHAVRAAEWQNILYEASCRLIPSEEVVGSASWRCQSAPAQGNADSIPASILAEVEASRGILPVVTYSLLRGSSSTARPIVWTRGSLILGGALVGLVVGGLFAVLLKRLRPD